MEDKDRYTREIVKERVEIDKDNLDLEATATICTMISETLYREAAKFTDVVEQLTTTYKNEFVMGDFSVCLAVSDGVHDGPIVSLLTGSVSGALKNIKCLTNGFKETIHDKAAD